MPLGTAWPKGGNRVGTGVQFPGGNPTGPAFPGGCPPGTRPGFSGGIITGPQCVPSGLPATENPPSPGNTAPAPMPPDNSGSAPSSQITGLSFAQVENYWIQAGGSPQAAAMAAAVADAESGLNAAAQRTNPDGTVGIGLWLIPQNGTPPGSTDPIANARAAVQLSQNGTDWTQWCSTWSDNNCGENNGTYLGSGANALMSLATQGGGYNVAGSTPTSIGTSASGATSGLTGGSTTGGGSKNYLLLGLLLVIVIAVFVLVNRKKAGKDTSTGQEA